MFSLVVEAVPAPFITILPSTLNVAPPDAELLARTTNIPGEL